MKKTVSFDTTIPSYLFDDRESLKYPCDITKKWQDEESENYDIFISTEAIAELSQGNYPKKDEILNFTNKLQKLESVSEIKEIAIYYIKNQLMPQDIMGDAIHLAYTSYYKIDYLLTWNCNHLANANKKQHIKIINGKLDLYTPEIITPLELFKER
jgi:predicted nucleic acid-binding protein